VVVVETGLHADVKTYIIMSPTIYAEGSGFFNTHSIQIPTMIRSAKELLTVGATKDEAGF